MLRILTLLLLIDLVCGTGLALSMGVTWLASRSTLRKNGWIGFHPTFLDYCTMYIPLLGIRLHQINLEMIRTARQNTMEELDGIIRTKVGSWETWYDHKQNT